LAFVAGLVALWASSALAGEQAKAGAAPLDKLPDAVKATLQKEAKGAPIRTAKTVYQAAFIVQTEDGRQRVEVLVDADGRLLDRRPNELVTMADLQAAILAEPKGDEVDEVERRVRRGETSYLADVGDDRSLSIRVDAEGKVVFLRCELPFADAPEAVKAAIRKRAPDAEVDLVERVTAEGRTAFRGELDLDGRNVQFEVDPNGTILRWDVEEDEDDDDEGDELDPPLAPAAPKPQAANLFYGPPVACHALLLCYNAGDSSW
jgi:hypothetical protein